MFRSKLARLYELKDLIADPSAPSAYFQKFDEKLCEPHIMRVYEHWERTLECLDDAAWADLKSEAAGRLIQRHPERGWQALFDILNQAHAFRYLKSIDCQNVAFIPRGSQRTPDLEASHDGSRLLCEVKTINISDEEVHRRNSTEAFTVKIGLTEGFFRKLSAVIDQARQQLMAYDPQGSARHMVYVSPCFDDRFGDCKELHFRQIDAHLIEHPVTDVQLVIHNARTALHMPVSMTAATVHNDD